MGTGNIIDFDGIVNEDEYIKFRGKSYKVNEVSLKALIKIMDFEEKEKGKEGEAIIKGLFGLFAKKKKISPRLRYAAFISKIIIPKIDVMKMNRKQFETYEAFLFATLAGKKKALKAENGSHSEMRAEAAE